MTAINHCCTPAIYNLSMLPQTKKNKFHKTPQARVAAGGINQVKKPAINLPKVS